jgi:hypothetical protein
MGKKKGQNRPVKLSYAERLLRQRETNERQNEGVDGDYPKDSIGEDSPQNLAKKLIEAQRQSIDMLSFIRQRVEALPMTDILSTLTKDGFAVIDDFLSNDDVFQKLEAEGLSMFQTNTMEQDLTKLGSGEYFCAVKGGNDQYNVIPRIIETVVSISKFLPLQVSTWELDNSNCIASLKVYDRSSHIQSMNLIQDSELPPQPYDTVIQDSFDLRRITLLYYLVQPSYREGGLTMEKGEFRIHAKRDRLILLNSESCRYRPEYFFDSANTDNAVYLELHLLKTLQAVD